MKKLLVTLILALSLGCATSTTTVTELPDMPESLYEWGDQYVWSVKRFSEGDPRRPKGHIGHGSGIWLSDTHMVTACHVPSMHEEMWASPDAGFYNGDYVDFKVNFCSRSTDQALMTATSGDHQLDEPIVLGDIPKRGERVYIIGFPGDHALTVTTGWFVGKNAGYDKTLNEDSWGLAADAMGGNSGGAVVVIRDGEIQLIGILVAGFGVGHITEMKDLTYTLRWLKSLHPNGKF